MEFLHYYNDYDFFIFVFRMHIFYRRDNDMSSSTLIHSARSQYFQNSNIVRSHSPFGDNFSLFEHHCIMCFDIVVSCYYRLWTTIFRSL